MKLFFVVFVSALALSAREPQADSTAKEPATKAAPKAAAKPAPKVIKPLPIPAKAVLGADGDYHYTDPQGKKWVYRKTPFGVTRLEDTPDLNSKPPDTSVAYIKATVDGHQSSLQPTDYVGEELLAPGDYTYELAATRSASTLVGLDFRLHRD